MMAIHLYLEGKDVVVAVEATKGQWVEVIRERADGCYSHIVEPSGIHARIYAADRKQLTELIQRSSIGEGLRDINERGIDAHLADLDKASK